LDAYFFSLRLSSSEEDEEDEEEDEEELHSLPSLEDEVEDEKLLMSTLKSTLL